MTPENFVYWLQGALELGKQVTFERDQVVIIQDHLDLVLKKETPMRPATVDNQLNKPILNFPRPYVGKPPFDFNNPPLITC